MDDFEKHIFTQIQNDQLNFNADSAIQERLMYHMQLKSAKTTVRKNLILPSLGALFTSKLLVWKLSFATMILISFMGYKQFNQNTSLIQYRDTAQVINAIDTTNILIKDSILRN